MITDFGCDRVLIPADDTHEAMKEVGRQLAMDAILGALKETRRSRARPPLSFKWWLCVAATAAACLALGIGLWRYLGKSALSPAPRELRPEDREESPPIATTEDASQSPLWPHVIPQRSSLSVTELMPDIFASHYTAILHARHLSTANGKMEFEILRYYQGSYDAISEKRDVDDGRVTVSERKWSWLESYRKNAHCIMYFGSNPSVDIILEIRGNHFACGRSVLFQGSLRDFESEMAFRNARMNPGTEVRDHIAKYRTLYEQWLTNCAVVYRTTRPAEKRRALVFQPDAIASTGKTVTAKTALSRGQYLQAALGEEWHAAEVLDLLADGTVRIHYVGRGREWDTTVSRSKLQLDDDALTKCFTTESARSALRRQFFREKVPE